MKKVLSLILISLLLAGCAPRPAQTEFADLPLLTDAPPAEALLSEGPATEAPTGTPYAPAIDLVLLTDAPQQETPAPTHTPRPTVKSTPASTESPVAYGEDYDDRDRVALYLHLFGELPPHFVTKAEARRMGWSGGEVEDFQDGAAIGGDVFANYEGKLPKKKGRTYYECDIGTVGRKKRGEKRIIYSNDGLIYYTDDHYESFILLYGEE